jgi:hypothetical protein
MRGRKHLFEDTVKKIGDSSDARPKGEDGFGALD